jgi:TonB family protein
MLGDSGTQEDLNWAFEMMKRTKRRLLATTMKADNFPFCPLCNQISEMIESGAELSTSRTDENFLVKVSLPDSSAKAGEITGRAFLTGNTGLLGSKKEVIAVVAKVSMGVASHVRHRDTGISFVYVPSQQGSSLETGKKFNRGATIISRILPQYPPLARANKVEGEVVFSVLVDDSGRVVDEKILRRTSNFNNKIQPDSISLFDSAVRGCVKQWIFKPAVENGKPIKLWYTDSLDFRIK